MQRLTEAYRRIRNTCRYLLGNLSDFDPETDRVPYEQMEELDRLALHRLMDLNERVLGYYKDFDFHLIYHSLHNFCVLDLSSFYLDVIKDRLYTSPRRSAARRSAQTAMNEILEVLVRLMAPILSFTADEIWQYMKGNDRPLSVHADMFVPVNDSYKDPQLASKWEEILAVRKEVTKALEIARKEKTIGHSLDASVTLGLSAGLMEKLTPYRDRLRAIFIVSSVELADTESVEGPGESETVPGLKVKIAPSRDAKCERCWVHDATVGDDDNHPGICERCLKSLAEMEVVGA
jgi:isoleucyl-tRNA synthetase